VEVIQEIDLHYENFNTLEEVFAYITDKFNSIQESLYEKYENVKIYDFYFSSYAEGEIYLRFKVKRDETREEELINEKRKNREKDFAWESVVNYLKVNPEFKERILNESKK
jgi:hypothetical protein